MPTNTVTPDVRLAIESELRYQTKKWQDADLDRPDAHDRTLEEFVLYMEHYLAELRRQVVVGEKHAARDTLRKVTALGVSAMSRHGAYLRGDV